MSLFTFVQVIPSKEQYVAVIFDDIRASLKTYIGECHEDVMVDGHKRAKERGESKLKFQVQRKIQRKAIWYLNKCKLTSCGIKV